MGDLVDRGQQQRLDGVFLFWCQRAKSIPLARHLKPGYILKLLTKRAYRWTDVQRPQCLLELHDFRFDDQLRAFGFTFALTNV